MPISERDVRRAAAAARLALDDREIAALAQEIDDLLGAARLVRKAHTADAPRVTGIGAGGMPLRADEGPAYAVARPLDAVRPTLHEGRLVAPPLASGSLASAPRADASAADAPEEGTA